MYTMCITLTLCYVLQLSHHLCMILLYDLLLGKGIQCGGPMKRFLVDHKKILLEAFMKSVERNSSLVQAPGMYMCTTTM